MNSTTQHATKRSSSCYTAFWTHMKHGLQPLTLVVHAGDAPAGRLHTCACLRVACGHLVRKRHRAAL